MEESNEITIDATNNSLIGVSNISSGDSIVINDTNKLFYYNVPIEDGTINIPAPKLCLNTTIYISNINTGKLHIVSGTPNSIFALGVVGNTEIVLPVNTFVALISNGTSWVQVSDINQIPLIIELARNNGASKIGSFTGTVQDDISLLQSQLSSILKTIDIANLQTNIINEITNNIDSVQATIAKSNLTIVAESLSGITTSITELDNKTNLSVTGINSNIVELNTKLDNSKIELQASITEATNNRSNANIDNLVKDIQSKNDLAIKDIQSSIDELQNITKSLQTNYGSLLNQVNSYQDQLDSVIQTTDQFQINLNSQAAIRAKDNYTLQAKLDASIRDRLDSINKIQSTVDALCNTNFNTVTDLKYTAVLKDFTYTGNVALPILFSNEEEQTLVIPSTVKLPIGASIEVIQLGLGRIKLTGNTSINIVSYQNGCYTGGQNAKASLIQIYHGVWLLSGELST